jgi:hypothetical protein
MANAALDVKTFKTYRKDKKLRATAFLVVSMSEGRTVVCSGAARVD